MSPEVCAVGTRVQIVDDFGGNWYSAKNAEKLRGAIGTVTKVFRSGSIPYISLDLDEGTDWPSTWISIPQDRVRRAPNPQTWDEYMRGEGQGEWDREVTS